MILAAGLILAGGGLGAVMGYGILTAIGFTPAGVLAGSVAAVWQASIGNVVAGSLFSWLQSMAATGTVWGWGLGIGAAISAIGTAKSGIGAAISGIGAAISAIGTAISGIGAAISGIWAAISGLVVAVARFVAAVRRWI